MFIIVLAIILFLHGFAHLVGFAGSWRLIADVPYKTTLLGGTVDVGDVGVRATGLIWLALALAFAVAGSAVIYQAHWWPVLVVVTATMSLLMCLVAWPEAQAGAALDAALIAVVLAGMRFGWFELATR